MKTQGLTTGQQKALFYSLKIQYESLQPMTQSEESTMWDLQGVLWKANGGKFGWNRVKSRV
tara:strand:- start:177 stop:359 length:183 start_codon:yes stop_codon:yes gene_type:complete